MGLLSMLKLWLSEFNDNDEKRPSTYPAEVAEDFKEVMDELRERKRHHVRGLLFVDADPITHRNGHEPELPLSKEEMRSVKEVLRRKKLDFQHIDALIRRTGVARKYDRGHARTCEKCLMLGMPLVDPTVWTEKERRAFVTAERCRESKLETSPMIYDEYGVIPDWVYLRFGQQPPVKIEKVHVKSEEDQPDIDPSQPASVSLQRHSAAF